MKAGAKMGGEFIAEQLKDDETHKVISKHASKSGEYVGRQLRDSDNQKMV